MTASAKQIIIFGSIWLFPFKWYVHSQNSTMLQIRFPSNLFDAPGQSFFVDGARVCFILVGGQSLLILVNKVCIYFDKL